MLNCTRLLTRILPYIFEDSEWKGFFWSSLPSKNEEEEQDAVPLAQSLLNAICVSFKNIFEMRSFNSLLNLFLGSSILS